MILKKNIKNFRVFPVIYEEEERRYYGRRVDRVRHEERLQEEEKKKSYNAEREEQRKAKEAKERWEQEENQRWVEAETRARESETIELYQLRMDGEAPEKEIKAWLVARMGEELKKCYVKKIEGSSRQWLVFNMNIEMRENLYAMKWDDRKIQNRVFKVRPFDKQNLQAQGNIEDVGTDKEEEMIQFLRKSMKRVKFGS